MKKLSVLLSIALILSFLGQEARAQFVATEVIKITVKRVIKAIDLKVQRLQNKTIWLQNAQKVIENELSKFKLTEISDWTQRQQKLYSDYYTELWKIKSTIAYYQRIKDLTVKQAKIVTHYRRSWSLFQQDGHFRPGELSHIQDVYSGILKASLENLDHILLAIDSFKMQMTDEQRLELINKAGNRLDQNYDDLLEFDRENIRLSLERSKDVNDTKTIKNLYGIN
ncbi:conjugal transfer protein TraI [Mucilaginibacter conchicola]|uniref:Conjugal transfer protein TraI n=1 Tax=Mucilaginibacter conchicola TaxID=2303333 RepID=A0A372NMP3_9SPHI|nr:conjugal transfer protein TraI [Mucilaginibacter conchicola]